VLVDLLAAMPTVADPTPAPAPDPPFLLSAPRPVISTIVIDPGHGGDDAGALGATGGLMEKDVALAVAERLERAIETRFGISVLQTRTDDRRVGPDERAAYANNAKGDLFISLHVNAAPQPTLQGASVLYLELDRYGDEVRRQAHLASGALPVFGGGSRAIDLVQWDMAQAQHVDGSAVLASLMERELRSRVIMSPEAVRQGPMRVLVGVNMPAVLIEMGYLTNPDDEAALASSAYQTRLVEAITEAIAAFRVYLEQLGEFEAR
jgi:N-acetylmuramoyl-L-alanine amidase